MTVLEAIKLSTEFLEKKQVDSPRLQAELLLAHVLKLPRMKLYMNFEQVLTSSQTDAYRNLLRRRGQREPLQYILSTTSFCGLELTLNSHVLIPRPETELLAELGWTFLSQIEATIENPSGLDFGTGSGCLAVTLAARHRSVRIEALDISAEALALARRNAEQNHVMDRIQFLVGDSFSVVRTQFDLIISNPPYIATQEIETLQPEVRDFEPRTALDGGPDGLEFFRRFAVEAGPFLKPGGKMILEFGDGQAERIKMIFEQENWIVEAIHNDYNQRARLITLRRK